MIQDIVHQWDTNEIYTQGETICYISHYSSVCLIKNDVGDIGLESDS